MGKIKNLFIKLDKGNLFYIFLTFLVAFAVFPLAASLVICLNSMDAASKKEQAALSVAIESQIQYWQISSPARIHGAQEQALKDEAAVLLRLSEKEQLEYDEDVQFISKLLRSIVLTDLPNLRKTYAYFKKSGTLIGEEGTGTQSASSFDPFIWNVLETIQKRDVNHSSNMYFTDDNGDYYAIYVALVMPDVYFLSMRAYGPGGLPFSYLSEELINQLSYYEVVYYDSYGKTLPVTRNQHLSGLYNYFTIGIESKGSFSFNSEGNSYFAHYLYNEDNNTKFVVYCADTIGQSLRTAKMILYVSAGGMLAIFFIFAVILTRKTYNPIGKLIATLPADNSGTIRDDFQVLANAIDSMDNKIKQQRHILARNCLVRLLKGQNIDGYEDCLPTMLLNENGDEKYIVIAIRIDASYDGQFPDQSSFEQDVMDAVRHNGYTQVLPVWDEDILLLITAIRHDGYGKLIQDAAKWHSQSINLSLSVYISEAHQTMRQLQYAYQQIMEMVEHYSLMEQYGTFQYYSEVRDIIQLHNSTPLDFMLMQKLHEAIIQLSPEDCLEQFDKIVCKLSTDGKIPKTGDMEFPLLVNMLSLAFYDVGLPGDINKEIVQKNIAYFKSAKDSVQLRNALKRCMENFSGITREQNFTEKRFGQIKTFIDKNFRDSNLCSKHLAERFETSPSNISRLFKKYNHTGFLEYVHLLRVSEASKLLANTDMTVTAIAEEVGYSNAITMFRAFKTYAHSSPGMVRKLHNQDDSR